METIAVGDIHGRADLLEGLLKHIQAHHADAQVVFLGDIIDRGPDSKDCLNMVESELARNPASRMILGNHEDLMLRFVDGGSASSKSWCWNGGLNTVASYGYKGYDFVGEDNFVLLRDELAEILRTEQASHIAMIRNAVAFFELPDFVLVHAGIDPTIPMDQQDPYKLRWDSKALIAHRDPLRKTIVHGHTVTDSRLPEVHVNRINLDCGAYKSGVLCAALLASEGRPSFMLSANEGGKIRVFDSPAAQQLKIAS
ncbi:serine/threonine protein phosphatase 1 [Rhizobium sp. BIGb0125]|uniref:metallophosphoesterase n=1 Tax=Rhizobium sp. BIGb0125 TaxID=2940618 RepID=UPI002166EA0A|nr:metallophosphoesterase [Rhizobium sp. BIGb0125]MCS4243132.1 serine/threonine protein phosphatase 1 [Rhizobium sp. BIGb0125]